MKNAKLQKEVNALAKCEMIMGELYISIDVKTNTFKELNEKGESTLKDLIVPKGFKITDNLLYRKDLKIWISFRKV